MHLWKVPHAALGPKLALGLRLPGRRFHREMLPAEISDEDAIAMAHKLSAKRKGPIDGFEVWDGARLIIKYLGPTPPAIA